MPVWGIALIVFGTILLYKAVSNFVFYRSTKRYYVLYKTYIETGKSEISKYQASVEKLLKRTGDKGITPITMPTGYGNVASFMSASIENLLNRREDIVSSNARAFEHSISVYRMRIIESFSLLFWVESIIFLPKKLFQYLGADSNSVLTKIVQVIYWVLAPTLLIFREQINNWIVSLMQ